MNKESLTLRWQKVHKASFLIELSSPHAVAHLHSTAQHTKPHTHPFPSCPASAMC